MEVGEVIFVFRPDKAGTYQVTVEVAGFKKHIQDKVQVQIGETRDLETAQIAIQASLTGHLVMTSLHTNDAAGAITRLVDMGVQHYLVASSLEAVLAHELAHVKHRDILISTISATMAGAIGMLANFGMLFGGRDANGRSVSPIAGLLLAILAPLAASLIQMAISRSREVSNARPCKAA